MVGVRKALTAGLISSQVALSNSHTLILYLSQGIKMDQLAAHRRYCWDSMRKPGAFLFSKAPLNLGSVQNFLVKNYTIVKRITFMLLRSWIVLTVTFLREAVIHIEDNKDAISITWTQLAAILTNVNGSSLSWKIIRMTLQCAPTGTIRKT